MQVGDLVRFVGVAATYRDRVGVVARFDRTGPIVHFAGLEGQGRAEGTQSHWLHPMYHDELEVINAGG